MKGFCSKLAVALAIIILMSGLCCPCSVFARKFSVSTNILGYLNFGTMNLEASYAVARHWSINVGAKFNPFTFQFPWMDHAMQNRQQSYSLGARLWPWHTFSGWWVGARLQYQEYNTGGIVSKRTEEGDGIGIGLSAGYSYMVHPHLNIEFGMGLWSGIKKYAVYDCPACGRTVEKGSKGFVMPNDIMISVVYVF